MKYVRQERDYGCAVACIAMITGESYSDVEGCFKENFDKQALSLDAARVFLCDHGYAAIEKVCYGYMDVRQSNKRMAVPFAPTHMVTVMPYINARYSHSVVMDAKGRVYDPAHPEIRDFKTYYSIVAVTGYFYEGEGMHARKRPRRTIKSAPPTKTRIAPERIEAAVRAVVAKRRKP